MLKNISIRLRFTLLTAFLLTICCIGLTLVLNFTVYRLVDKIDSTMILIPSQESVIPENQVEDIEGMVPSPSVSALQETKQGFSAQSIIYMLIIVIGGSAFTYYISGKALKPLVTLNGQVKNINVHNLSETMAVPQTKDEIAELTQSFNEMTDKLNNAFMMQQRFSASAAHELRTPLAVLQAKVDVFKMKNTHTNEEYEALISIFDKQIKRLRGLVGNLLDLTNMDDNFEKSSICIIDIFEDIISELTQIAKEKRITLCLDHDDSIVFGNTDLLYRAFYNLVENGIKYNTEGGFVNVIVKEINERQVSIKIKDTGIGIPEESKKNIFEPFYRVETSRSHQMGGVGLGLSIVDIIIKKHKGIINVSDNEDSGTCFEVILNSKFNK